MSTPMLEVDIGSTAIEDEACEETYTGLAGFVDSECGFG